VSSLRLVLVTRRFWPLVGGAEGVMANLAAEFASRGVDVTLLTAQWHPDWPVRVRYRGVSVIRLANPSLRGWGTFRYMRALERWLRRRAGHYDLVYVSMLKHDAYTTMGAAGGVVPVVLRAEGAGASGDCIWQLDANFGRRIKRRCIKADAVIGPSRAVERELIAAGYPRAKIHYLPNGVAIPPRANQETKKKARATLAELKPELSCPPGSPIAVYTGRLHEAKGLADLVSAWSLIVARWPNARLWLVGEGPFEQTLRESIAAQNLSGRVVLAGVFDNVDELLTAADLFVLPSLEEGMSLSMLEAMAVGLPVVSTDIPGNQGVVTHQEHGLLVPTQDVNSLAAAIEQLLDDRQLATRLADAASVHVREHFSVAGVVDRHLELFDDLLRADPSQDQP
jgi:glycosyltransferase involved in cell wall biosynthesis